jgi:crotonobetainyl-CoA:carnitine CoA-transferase CaiB-like acyl-CoA transferase
MASSLDGIRIIDATEGTGGALASMLLADHGADVIKVEPPAGVAMRAEARFHVLNRSKRSVTLDLDSDGGREKLRRLIASSDVFLYDWQPGRDASLGFDEAALRAINPALVAGYLPAYGSKGPWAHLPPDEALVQAVSALSHAQFRYDPAPVYVTIPIAGYAHAVVAAVAIAASLYARTQNGAGDSFELSGVAACFAMETIAWLRAEGVTRLAGQQDPRGPIPTYRLVPASDGWFFAGALTPPFWAKLAVAAGLEDCLVDPRFAAAPMGIADLNDRRELARRVSDAFSHMTLAEALRLLEDADVPRAPVLSREEWARDPQVQHNNSIVDVDDPVLGPTKQMGGPVSLRHSPGAVRGPAPLLGEHDRLFDEIAARERPRIVPKDATARRYPLDGIVVLDLGGFIAGASASMMLADLGANVIKIESPDGDGWRSSGLAFLGSNRSKRGLCIDLKRPEGRDLFLDMAERADVVLDNLRAGVMDRLGIGWDALRARNPRIVHCSVTGYGGSGPYAHLPGFDPMIQARGGFMRAQGEPGGEPVYLQLPTCDYGTALSAAYGMILALIARERTGMGDRVETSLADSAFTMQAGEFLFYEGKQPESPGGRDLAGRHALYRVYEAADGYLMLACTTQEHAAALVEALGIKTTNGDQQTAKGQETTDNAATDARGLLEQPLHGALAGAVGAKLRECGIAHWLSVLLPLGVPIAACVTVEQLFDDEHTHANDLWWSAEHPRWGRVQQTGEVIHWSAMSMHLQRRAPVLGEHTVECLRELGVAEGWIDALLTDNVIVQAEL